MSEAKPLLEVDGVTLQYKTKEHLVTATYRVDFNERGIDPEDLRSVNSILELIARESAS